MLDPIVAVSILALGFLDVSSGPIASSPISGDPGPSRECPDDMRLVTGTHYDEIQHLCVDPRTDSRDTHCFAYWEGVTAAEGSTQEVRVCMDQFEAPNQRGVRPYVMKSFRQAERWCKQRNKRACSEQEWETACEGPEYRPLAYGWSVDKKVCNSNKGWRPFDAEAFARGGEDAKAEVTRLWQGSQSGRYLDCVSPFGVYDMMGNVEEWVSTRDGRGYPGALMGGFWAKPWTGCRGTNDAHEPTFQFYETGFRCCASPSTLDAKGQPISTADQP